MSAFKPRQWLETGRRFLLRDLWIDSINVESRLRKAVFFLCRIIIIIVRGYQEDKCSLQASGLTYITLVSMVPVLAIMLSFSKGIGMQTKLIHAIGLEEYRRPVVQENGATVVETLYRVIPAQPTEDDTAEPHAEQSADAIPTPPGTDMDHDIDEQPQPGLAATLPVPMQQAIVNIMIYVQKTNFAALGLVGSLMLLVSVILSMAKLERNINTIWGIKRGRPLARQFSEYLVVLIMLPVAFVAATSLNTMLASNRYAAFLVGRSQALATVIGLFCRSLSVLFIMAGFVFFYIFMPNTKVRFVPACIAGVLTCMLWFIVQWAYIVLQVGLANYNAIYGTFAVVPFFLAWLYANWSLVLFGAEVSFALQNHRTLKLEKASDTNSYGSCIILAFLIVCEVCRNYLEGRGAWLPDAFASSRAIPTKTVQAIVEVLRRRNILLPVAGDQAEQAYLPGLPPDQLTLDRIEEAFREQDGTDARQYLEYLPKSLARRFAESYEKYQRSLASLTFQSIIAEGEEKP